MNNHQTVQAYLLVELGHGAFDAVHNSHGANEIEKFSVPIRRSGGGNVAAENARACFIDAQLDLFSAQSLRHLRQQRGRDGFIDEQCFHRIANAGAMGFGIHGDCDGFFRISFGVEIYAANAFVMFDDRHLRAICHRADEPLTTARDAEIHQSGEPRA